MVQKKLLIAFGALLGMTVSACGNESGAPDSANPSQPITLKLQMGGAYNEVFKKYVVPLAKKEMPNVTLDLLEPAPNYNNLKKEVAAGDSPDIIMSNGNINSIMQLGLEYDMSDLIKKYNFDLTKIDQPMLESAKALGSGHLYTLPSDRNVHDLLYNKDIFDKFGVPYPKDGMTWDDVIALSRKLTRKDGAAQYYGLNLAWYDLPSELQLPVFGPDGKAQVTTPNWQKVATTWQSIFQPFTPGRPVDGDIRGQFTKQRNVAMILTNSSWLLRDPIKGFNWDYVTAPTFDNHLIPSTIGAMLGVTSASKYKDTAFKVMEIYYSTEVQSEIARTASLVSVENDPQILNQYGVDLADHSKKNLMADFKGKSAVTVVQTNDDIPGGILGPEFSAIGNGKTDINTALADAEANINKQVLLRQQQQNTK